MLMHAEDCVVCGLSRCNVFPRYLLNGKSLEKKLRDINTSFDCLYKFYMKDLIIRIIKPNIIINIHFT
jgi:hypothetical protein